MKKKTPDINVELASAMREPSRKWDFIHKIIEDEKKSIDNNIHTKKSDNGAELDAKQIFDLATWYGFLDYVANLPEMILEQSKPRKKQSEPDFETYDTPIKTVREEIINDE